MIMDWQESLEIVVARTGHERYRWLCSDANPTCQGHRQLMMELAGVDAPPAPPRAAPPSAEDLALRALVGRHGGCCGGGITA